MDSKLNSASLDLNQKKPLNALDLLKQSIPSKSLNKPEVETISRQGGLDVIQLSEAAKMLLKQSDSLAQSLSSNPEFAKSFVAQPGARPGAANYFKLADVLRRYQDVSNQYKPVAQRESK